MADYKVLNSSDDVGPVIIKRPWIWSAAGLVILVGVVALAIYIDDTYISTCASAPTDAALLRGMSARPNTTIAWITPASPITEFYPNIEQYEVHVEGLVDSINANLSFIFTTYAFGPQVGYFSANDSDRASDVMEAFSDPNVTFIIANRGGWGTNRIIDMLDYDLIKANAKPIMGYSDLTGLLNAIHMKTGLVTFHGPMGMDNWPNGVNQEYINQVIIGGEQITYVNLPPYTWTTVVPGKAKGRLIGGCLSVFVAMIPSHFVASDFTGKILFFEDVDEAPDSIDRMLTNLHLAGVFDEITGFVFGQCSNCLPPNNESFTWEQVIEMRMSPLTNIPSYYGAMFGHAIDIQFILPIGALVEIDTVSGTITMLEPAVNV